MRTPLTAVLCLILAVALPTQGLAQEDDDESPPVLAISWYQCDWNEVGRIMTETDSMNVPIWEDLVEEGMIASAGTLTHWQADEWNVAYYIVGEDIPAILAAQQEANSRLNERYPDYDFAAFLDDCPVHKDLYYHFGPRTMDDDEGGAADEENGAGAG